MSMIRALVELSDRYCGHAQLSRSRLSTIIFNDGKALDRIAAGGDLNTRSYEKAMAWLSENWPEGVAWPEEVERPAPHPGLRPTLSPEGRGEEGEAAA